MCPDNCPMLHNKYHDRYDGRIHKVLCGTEADVEQCSVCKDEFIQIHAWSPVKALAMRDKLNADKEKHNRSGGEVIYGGYGNYTG